MFIIYDWAKTCFENIFRLTGSAVDERLYEKLTFLAWRFSPLVNGYKSINAYHAGDGVWVEVDILLDEKTTLEVAHDIAETLVRSNQCAKSPFLDILRGVCSCEVFVGRQ